VFFKKILSGAVLYWYLVWSETVKFVASTLIPFQESPSIVVRWRIIPLIKMLSHLSKMMT